MTFPSWYQALVNRVKSLAGDYVQYGLDQCRLALETLRAYPNHEAQIAWQLTEVVESLEMTWQTYRGEVPLHSVDPTLFMDTR